MISNNVKIKTSKPELVKDFEILSKDSESITEGIDEDVKRSSFVPREYNSRTVTSNKERPNIRGKYRDDFRMARGGQFRGAPRGRTQTTTFTRKGTAFENQKYDGKIGDTTKNNGKEPENKSKYEGTTISSEDSRISKLLRRLAREEDVDKFLALAKQLQESIMLEENSSYILRSFDLIVESLLDLLHTAPNDQAKQESAKCLGKVGYVLANKFTRFLDWLFPKFYDERNEVVKVYLIKSLYETLMLEKSNHKLAEYGNNLMKQMKLALENTEYPELLIASVDVILILTEIYPDCFHKHFRDVVDILVGWGVSLLTPNSLINFTVKALHKLSIYWISDFNFTAQLLKQFLDDTEGYLFDLQVAVNRINGNIMGDNNNKNSPETSISLIVGLLKVFNTVASSMDNHLANDELLPSWITKMLSVVSSALDLVHNNQLITTANVGVILLLTQQDTRDTTATTAIISYLLKQISLINELEEETLISMLQFVSRIVKLFADTLPTDFIHQLFQTNTNIIELKFSPSHAVVYELQVLFQTLIDQKLLRKDLNRYIYGDMEKALKVLTSCKTMKITDLITIEHERSYTMCEAEITLVFYLQTLARSCTGPDANQYEFQTLINMRPSDVTLARNSPASQFSLLYLLYSHCSGFRHFVSYDNIQTDDGQQSNSKFTTILQLLSQLLVQVLPCETINLLLKWCEEVLIACRSYIPSLVYITTFNTFVNNIVTVGNTCYKEDILIQVYQCLCVVVSELEFDKQTDLTVSILNLCTYHKNSLSSRVSDKYTELFTKLPFKYTLSVLCSNHDTDELQLECKKHVYKVLHEYFSKATYGCIESRDFGLFMSYLTGSDMEGNDKWLLDIFLQCYPLQLSNVEMNEHKQWCDMKMCSVSSCKSLLSWASWECAQLCVLNKLRTTLGKPPETFTSIENLIKTFARQTKQTDLGCDSRIQFHRAASLTLFVEYLEKVMYNASEGTAVALLPPPKNVRTFFNANKSTCAAWLSRIRLAVIVVAMHTGQTTIALRNGQCLLSDLIDSHSTQGNEFETAVLYTAWACLCLKESEALIGLYSWCRHEAEKKFLWLKAMADHAAGRYELAVETYISILNQAMADKSSLAAEDSPSKTKKHFSPIVKIFLSECVIDCCRKTMDGDNLKIWINTSNKIKDESTNGTHTESFFHNRKETDKLTLPLSFQSTILDDKFLTKYRKKDQTGLFSNTYNFCTSYESPFKSIQDIDESILEAKISPSIYKSDDKFTMSQLSSWTDIVNDVSTNLNKNWSVFYTYEEVLDTITHNSCINYIRNHFDCANSTEKTSVDCFFEKFTINNNDKDIISKIKQIQDGYDTNVANIQVNNCIDSINNQIKQYLTFGQVVNIEDVLILQYAANNLKNVLNENVSRSTFGDLDTKSYKSDVWLKVKFWKKLFNEADIGNDNICLLKSTRKEENYNLSKRIVCDYLKCDSNADTLQLSSAVLNNFMGLHELKLNDIKTFTQVAKLIHCTHSSAEAIEFGASLCLRIMRFDVPEVKEISSRMLLTLAKWSQREASSTTDETLSFLALESLTSCHTPVDINHHILSLPSDMLNEEKVIPATDMIIGRILSLSVAESPGLSKAWSHFASWCYRWGRKIVDVSSRSGSTLTENELAKIRAALPWATPEQFTAVVKIMSHTRSVADEDNIEDEKLNTSDMIKSQLEGVEGLIMQEDVLALLVTIWRDAQKRIYSAFEKAALAYFKYLQLCADSQCENSWTITATLRILRLLVKYALELQTILEDELSTTPTRPWQGIIPQLFSRLNHPECYVRKRVSELLCRIAQVSPHLITFPAVVGSSAGANRITDINTSTSRLLGACLSTQSSENELEGQDEDEDDDEEEEDEDLTMIEDQGSVLTNCFLSMVDTLTKQAPESITQVQIFVGELRRITLLWDELWLGTLNQHHAEVNRRLNQLVQEVYKVDNNSSLSQEEKTRLIAEKHRIILKPVVFVLEQLITITSVPPETPLETWFQQKMLCVITEALEKLKNPVDPRKPMDSWHPFKVIHCKLQKRAQKRGFGSLKMDVISPVLAEMKNTAIAMPGVSSSNGRIVTITAIDNNIVVLPTKTKPKKLVFYGSDGKSYTYLFKGLEDLHLDERIMQFLTIANTMMASTGDVSYRARHYSVTPLGPRSGLISWVDDVTPLFALYKKWQQRDAANNTRHNSVSGQATMRPSELFYAKLTPLLKEANIHIENRKEWPLYILKQVLQELMAETPKDLLAKELWCNSVDADAWWTATKTYSRSVAVMSVIGYIIGLGDRHLDNVLIDLNTGEMVHIDYNVCFEKGKTLRVPEKIPFRMTQNIQTALGVTGVEGQFRLACEHVLKIVKKGRDTLLPLLEAFVYDPLIDWTPGNETGYTGAVYGGGGAVLKDTKYSKKTLEREVTKAMFVVRVTEMKAEWFSNRDAILKVIPKVVKQCEDYLKVGDKVRKIEEELGDSHQQMALVKEAEVQGNKHPLFNLASRCSVLIKARAARNELTKYLFDKITECDRDSSNYLTALTNIKSDLSTSWVQQLSSTKQPDSYQTFDLVKEFLQTAGQSSMVNQCDQQEQDIGNLDQQQRQLMRSCVDLLREYAALIALYPCTIDNHRSYKYKDWCERILNKMEIETCQKVQVEFQNTSTTDSVTSKQVISYTRELQSAISDAQNKLKKVMDRYQNEIQPESRTKLEQNYKDAKERMADYFHLDRKACLAVELVTISSLCSVNKRFIQMEVAAKSAEDELAGMRLKEGQGWLEEMYIVSGLMSELASRLPTQTAGSGVNNNNKVDSIVNCLKKAHSIFHSLLELNYNFHSIILPEAQKWMQTEHPDMLSMVQELNEIADVTGVSLDELQKQLKLHLRCAIMGMESPHSNVQLSVSLLRNKFETLLQRPCEDATRSPGQMLLMGFNGLFEKLQVDGTQLTSTLCSLEIPAGWKKIDQFKDTNMLTALVLNEATRSITEDIFLVKRMQTMQEFFQLCNQAGKAFRGVGVPIVHDDERLNKPIRKFTAEYVSRSMLGVTSQTLVIALCLLLERLGLDVNGEIEQIECGTNGKVQLDDLCRRAMDLSLQRNYTTNHAVAQATTIITSMQTVYRQKEKANLLTHNVEDKTRSLSRLQVMLTAHSWLHEDVLLAAGVNNVSTMNRANFMTKLRKSSSVLFAMQSKLTEAREAQKALVSNVEQRLKWAAGANPAVHEVMSAFDSSITQLNKRLDEDQTLAVVVANTCTAILRHEALRTRTSEAAANDEAFLKMLKQCEDTAVWLSQRTEYITPAEESLLSLMTPDCVNDPKRLLRLESKISENIEAMKLKMQKLGEVQFVTKQTYEAKVGKLRTMLENHHSLMTEVRHLLKSMVKFEECSDTGLPEFLDKYRMFSEEIGVVVKQLSIQELDQSSDSIRKCIVILESLPDRIVEIYDELVSFASEKVVRDEFCAKRRPPLARQDGVSASPTTRDPRTGKAVQERNAYAVSVWRRIQMKLEGRDPDPGRRSTVHEQVDFIIREATNIDSLALLYEGWTPWV